MNHAKMQQRAVEEAGLRHADGLWFDGSNAEVTTVTEFRASFRGHAVTVQFLDSPTDPAEYRYNARVLDGETGELVATGNGASDLDTALSIVHWNDLNSRWPEV